MHQKKQPKRDPPTSTRVGNTFQSSASATISPKKCATAPSLSSSLQQTLLTALVFRPATIAHRRKQPLARNHDKRSLFRIHPRPIKSRLRSQIPRPTLPSPFPRLESQRALRIPQNALTPLTDESRARLAVCVLHLPGH